MPKRYKADLGHCPLGWGVSAEGHLDNEVEVFAASLDQSGAEFLAKLETRGMTLEMGERETFLGDLENILIDFLITCRAHPLRTPNMMIPTARKISRDPVRFFQKMPKYSPDVVALVYQELSRIIPRETLFKLEVGLEKSAPLSETKKAAKAAVAVLRRQAEEQRMGRPRQQAAERLAVRLGRLFLDAGGTLGRTHDYVTGQERGPFREFLELIISLVDPIIRTTGHQLNPDTMVRWAQNELLAEVRG